MLSGPVKILFSENINIFLQSFGNSLVDKLFIAITNLGSYPVYFILASIIFWCFSKKTGIRAMYLILFSAFIAIFAKNILVMPRPPEHLHKTEVEGFGFPSAHAQVSAGFWGYLGGITRNQKIILIGAAAVILVSLSRVYLGVHYIGDVIAGILFGLLIAVISLKAESWSFNRRMSRIKKYRIAVMLPAILIIFAAVSGLDLEQLVELWMIIVSSGLGYLLEEERIGLEDAKNNRQRLLRAISGLLLVAVVYMMFYPVSNLVFFDSIKYAALGFTSTFVAPWMFVRMERKFMLS